MLGLTASALSHVYTPSVSLYTPPPYALFLPPSHTSLFLNMCYFTYEYQQTEQVYSFYGGATLWAWTISLELGGSHPLRT